MPGWHDIILPPAPLAAPEFNRLWLLATLFGVLALLSLAWLLYQRWQGRQQRQQVWLARWQQYAEQLQQADQQQQTLQQISMSLKRLALDQYPEADIAALHGADWLRWLQQQGCRICAPCQPYLHGWRPLPQPLSADAQHDLMQALQAWTRIALRQRPARGKKQGAC